MKKANIPVSGMSCANCAMNIERSVKKLEGVISANVNFASEEANIEFDPQKTDIAQIAEKIEKAGFSVKASSISFP